MELYTVNDITKETDIPESTVRRYCRRFSTFIIGERFNNVIKYPHETIEILQYIYSLYQAGKNTDEIRKELKIKYKEVIEVDLPNDDVETDMTVYNNALPEELLNGVMDAFNKSLEQNNILLSKVMEQDKKIEQLEAEIKKLKDSMQSDMSSKAKKRGLFGIFGSG